ncbi:MAG: hypothetical protein K9I74_02510 [Bacteroidales bacterium]|nr:hypothetical protein [Bacteroidales bacterium]
MKRKTLLFLSLLVFSNSLLVGSTNNISKPAFQSATEQDSADNIQNKNDTLENGDNFQRRIPSETAFFHSAFHLRF